ncbi:MAG: hypothetical protein AVDCRST_MAG43-1829, partial [uncultured Thermomicrobiales bacterium]
ERQGGCGCWESRSAGIRARAGEYTGGIRSRDRDGRGHGRDRCL